MRAQLIIFADDWGAHPSSTQHLVRRLLPRHDVLWVNTIGLRTPQFNLDDAARALRKIGRWLRHPLGIPANSSQNQADASRKFADPKIISPLMYPGFRSAMQKKINAKLMRQCIHRHLPPRKKNVPRLAITTLPITADLMGSLDVDAWIYSCVDDFSLWPGSDGAMLRDMEKQVITKANLLIAASENLREGMKNNSTQNKTSGIHLLTHGIDIDHWNAQKSPVNPASFPPHWPINHKPIILFWGLIDPRLDTNFCRAIAQSLGPQSALVFVGPEQSADPALIRMPQTFFTGPVAYENLPLLAQAADVLVMPYADLPVTRLMQPLKFKEYLATQKPVVVRDLPATQPWADACDLARNEKDFVTSIQQRLATGLPEAQKQARKRLQFESWDAKADEFEKLILTIAPTIGRR